MSSYYFRFWTLPTRGQGDRVDAPQLQVLDLEDEVGVPGRVLLDHVLDVVRLQGVLETLPGAHHQHLRRRATNERGG